MNCAAIEKHSTRAEDKATVGTDLSAAPGAKTEGRAADRKASRPSSPAPFGIGTNAINPSRRSREQTKHPNASMPGDGLPDVANSERPMVHFTMNQYSPLGTSRKNWRLDWSWANSRTSPRTVGKASLNRPAICRSV
jgi:hypothetical protein